MRLSLAAGLAWMAMAASVAAAPPGKVIDNDEVAVWDVTLNPGEQGPATPRDMDAVVMYLEGGTVKSEGSVRSETNDRKFGDAVFIARGSNVRDTLVKGGTTQGVAHQVVVWLKNVKPKTIANPTQYPTAWPRPGAEKALENDRVIVWNYSWIEGRPAPMHFHIHQQVVAERYDGAIKTITPDGKVSVGPTKAGEIRFTEPNRLHSEEWDSGKVSAVVLELK
jgi:hypothetical protein